MHLLENFISIKRKFLEREFAHMNDKQQEVVFNTEGRVMVLAGAGTGKTTTLVNRIANMVKYGNTYDNSEVIGLTQEKIDILERGFENGKKLADFAEIVELKPVLPENILAITFTNKAAREIKIRLALNLGDVANDVWSSTFHSLCVKILRDNIDVLEYAEDFAIYDSDDTKRLIRECQRSLNIDEKNFPIRSCISAISCAKDNMIDVREFKIKNGGDIGSKQISRIYEMYQAKLKNSGAMDFDDLITNTVTLLSENKRILEKYQGIFRYIMVDEYQDTSFAQHKLITLLSGKNGNLCIVGDDDQSIYGFRGASVENILKFDKTFEGVRVVRLEQNYRSTKNILDCANSVIKNNTERKEKTLWTSQKDGNKIRLHTAYSEHDEANIIVQEIKKQVKNNNKKYSNFAVLYRMALQSNVLEKVFAVNSIPYRVFSGMRFFDRAEIRDLIAYLGVINNTCDEVRMRRVINRPKRSIGERTISIVSDVALKNGKSCFEIMCNADKYPELQRAVVKVVTFVNLMEKFLSMNASGEKLSDIYQAIVDDTHYLDFIKQEGEDIEIKTENVKELGNFIVNFEKENGDNASLTKFLEEISLVSDPFIEEGKIDFVSLMTVHSAKGLEFPVVFVPGFEENMFPGVQCLNNPDNIEEERRLAYVAFTRAKEELFILNSTSRMIFGNTNHNKPSRFLAEIPEKILEITKSKEWKKMPDAQEKPKSTYELRVRSVVSARNFSRSSQDDRNNQADDNSTSDFGTVFSPGEIVNHTIFGKGTIVSSIPIGGDKLLEINFEKIGIKKMMSNLARLKKFV
ncbi:MAG: UvrD-helicase domain-containing protein [Oscillospiraceae bacterium]|nr:UvrD-helicase domain-containing protein [Oscillospiraceae bacterium]